MRVCRGTTVSGEVGEIISRNRSIRDCVRMGIVNCSSLDVRIGSDVEHLIRRSANHNTLVVAIKRYADLIVDTGTNPNVRILKNDRFSLPDGILDIRPSQNAIPTHVRPGLSFTHLTLHWQRIHTPACLHTCPHNISIHYRSFL